MRNVFLIGETVYDIIFKNNKPVESRPGGAMLNTAVSLAKLGIQTYLVGDYANDTIGDIIDDFLVQNKVKTDYITRYDDAKSRLALAFLDDENNAEYSFYKIRKEGQARIERPEFKYGDIVLFGSFYGIKAEIRPDLLNLLKSADDSGAIIIYDPNFRKAHLPIKEQIQPFIKANILRSDIVKGSDEDFKNIFDLDKPSEVYEMLLKQNKSVFFIYTANKNGVWVFYNNREYYYEVPQIEPLSTIGAGDTFNAGLIYSLIENNIKEISPDSINDLFINKAIDKAVKFSQKVCMSYDNYLNGDVLE